MIKIIKGGNLLEAEERVIIHQTNCQGVMGSGVALAIRNKYPKHYEDFMNDKRLPTEKLGSYVCTRNGKIIYGLYGQLDYRDRTICNTNYEAFTVSLANILFSCASEGIDKVAMPYLIACDLAGGDWNIISAIIERCSILSEIDIVLYDINHRSE